MAKHPPVLTPKDIRELMLLIRRDKPSHFAVLVRTIEQVVLDKASKRTHGELK